MFFNLLTQAPENSSTVDQGNPIGTWIMLGVMVLIIVAFMIYNRHSQKKKQEETTAMLDAIKPGNKVKTIGGICGVVVEVCPDDQTFVLETGTEASGKSYLKFDRQAVYQTDAVAEKKETKKEDKKTEEPVKEEPAENKEEK